MASDALTDNAGNLQATSQCLNTPPTPITFSSASGLQQIFAGVSGKIIVGCQFSIAFSTAPATMQVEYGTGTNCGTGTTALTGPIQNPMTMTLDVPFSVPAGNNLCLNLGSSVTGGGWIEAITQ